MAGVPSALVARNASWVRKQAQSFARHLPANVEKADLIQAGLIAVAQAALHFDWPDDPETDETREAFVRYARQRVKGAMLDELRQMDSLTRAQRRKVRVVEIARERWQASTGLAPTLAQLAGVCGFDVDEIATLDRLAAASQAHSLDAGGDDEHGPWIERLMPATEHGEVEARVDTAIVMRRLEAFFAKLPERERQVIDAYMGVGLSPVELAATMKVTPSRVAQMYGKLVKRLAVHFGHAPQPSPHQRATDQLPGRSEVMDDLVAQRQAALKASPEAQAWDERMEAVLMSPAERFGIRIDVPEGTRW